MTIKYTPVLTPLALAILDTFSPKCSRRNVECEMQSWHWPGPCPQRYEQALSSLIATSCVDGKSGRINARQ